MPDKKFITQYIHDYLDKELCVTLNMTKSGYKSYKTALTLFLDFASKKLRKKSVKILTSEIKYKLVYKFMVETAEERNWSSATWNARLAGVKAFFKFLSLTDPWFMNTYRRIRLISNRRLSRSDPFYLSEDNFLPIFDNFQPNSWIAHRDYTMIQFMLATGLRAAEVCSLKAKQILWVSSHTIHIRFKGKGRKNRVVPVIDNGVITNLKRLLSFSDVQSKYVFPSDTGHRMSESNLGNRVTRFFKPYKYKKKVTPHVLRRSAAMKWLRDGSDIFHVSAMLGHEHISTTQKYVRSNLEDRVEEMRRNAKGNKNFEPFKPREDHDEFLEGLMKKKRRRT